jgi:hypothetical protein
MDLVEPNVVGSHYIDLIHRLCGLYNYLFVKNYNLLKVGDALVPLLRTVSASGGKEGMMVTRTFNNIQYVKLHRKQFNTVNVLIN